jgi:RHH-type rel operon transcriptional repressor/antitoxin RelB
LPGSPSHARVELIDEDGGGSRGAGPKTALEKLLSGIIARRRDHLGRTRSFLVAEALNEYLDANEWQVAGVKRAIASLDRGEGVSHKVVTDRVNSWDRKPERPVPKRSAT